MPDRHLRPSLFVTAAIPEPSTAFLLGLGMIGLAVQRRR
jgi:hypothetical protein